MHAPGPRGQFISGSLREFDRDKLEFFSQLTREYGDLTSFRLGPVRLYLASHPDMVREILIDNARSYQKAERHIALFRRFLGDSMLTLEGAAQKQHRKLSLPAFNHANLATYGETMVDCTLRRIASWREDVEMDAVAELQALTVALVTRTLLGLEEGPESEAIAREMNAVNEAFIGLVSSMIPWPEWVPTRLNQQMRHARRTIDELLLRLIADKAPKADGGTDLLSVLRRATVDGEELATEQLLSELKTFYVAGFETTARALAWIWYLLAKHPGVQSKLHDEVAGVLQGREPTYQDLRRLTYVERVVKETMRLYPPAYAFTRMPAEDVRLGGHPLRRGDVIFISPWVLHRDERWYPSPTSFDPDRWTPEFTKALPKGAFIPFSAGPRICLGWEFAMMNMILVVATVIPKFALEAGTTPEPQPVGRLSLNLDGKVGFRVRRRTRVSDATSARSV